MILINKGITLIEVVITITILSFISVFTFTTTQTGFNIRNKTVVENDFYHSIRIAFRHIERDIKQAFHHYQDTSMGQLYYMQRPIVKAYESKSLFKGTKNELTFTSTSHRRIYKDSRETSTCEISYYIEADKENKSLDNVVKRESYFIDDKLEEGGDLFVIAKNVEYMKFRYLGDKPDYWKEKWNSLQGEDIYKFPLAVEVTIGFKRDEELVEIKQIIRILNSNNINRSAASSTSGESN